MFPLQLPRFLNLWSIDVMALPQEQAENVRKVRAAIYCLNCSNFSLVQGYCIKISVNDLIIVT